MDFFSAAWETWEAERGRRGKSRSFRSAFEYFVTLYVVFPRCKSNHCIVSTVDHQIIPFAFCESHSYVDIRCRSLLFSTTKMLSTNVNSMSQGVFHHPPQISLIEHATIPIR